MSRELLKIENENRREFEQLERDMQCESPETGENWYDERFGLQAYELGVRHGAKVERLAHEELTKRVAVLEEQREALLEFARELAGEDWRGNRPGYIHNAARVLKRVYAIAQGAGDVPE